MDFQNMSIEEVLLQFEPLVKKQIISLQIYKNQDEFLQIGLIGIWEAYYRFNPEKGAFPAFAQSTVRGKLLTHLRKEHHFDQNYISLNDDMLEVIEDKTEIPLEKELIMSYCDGLTERQKKWVMQAFLENKKPSEIAEMEGVPVDRVKGWRKEALKKILRNYKKMLD